MLIEFSEFNIKLILPFIFPIFRRIQDYTNAAYMNEGKDSPIFTAFRYFLSYIFAGILLLIVTYRTKNSKNVPSNNESNPFLSKTFSKKTIDYEIKIKKKKMIFNGLFLLLLCVLALGTFYSRYLFLEDDFFYAKQSTRTFFEMTNYTSLSILILKQKLFKHHYFAGGCITFMLLIIFFISLPYMKNILESFIYFFLIALGFAFYDVLKKKYMNLTYNTPYFMMLVIGLVNTILLLIFDVFAYYLNRDISGIIVGFQDNIDNVGEVFLFILDLIMEFMWNLGIWLLIFYFTPCHFFISEYVSDYFYYALNFRDKKDEYFSTVNFIIFTICYLINFFCILIFNEVIILNFWGLDANTTKRIKQRENSDQQLMLDLKNVLFDNNNNENTDDNSNEEESKNTGDEETFYF